MAAPKGNLFALGNTGGRPPNVIDNMMCAITCKCCGVTKNYNDFPPNNAKLGINTKCKECTFNSYDKVYLRVRGHISRGLKSNNKSDKTVNLLGCTIDEYKEYLKSKFTNKMSWDNYGSYWEIDHIIPMSLFDLSKPHNQVQAFHYTNTQPLTVFDNRSKNNRTNDTQLKIRM